MSKGADELRTNTKDGTLLRPWLLPRIRPCDLARAANVSPQYVNRVISGKRPPSKKLLDAAGTLGIPTTVIYGSDE